MSFFFYSLLLKIIKLMAARKTMFYLFCIYRSLVLIPRKNNNTLKNGDNHRRFWLDLHAVKLNWKKKDNWQSFCFSILGQFPPPMFFKLFTFSELFTFWAKFHKWMKNWREKKEVFLIFVNEGPIWVFWVKTFVNGKEEGRNQRLMIWRADIRRMLRAKASDGGVKWESPRMQNYGTWQKFRWMQKKKWKAGWRENGDTHKIRTRVS